MGFDAGTQSVKVAVCDENFNLIASRSLATTLRYPHPGWVEMDVENYLENCLECMRLVAEDLRAAGRDPKDVAAVMGDGVICGIVGIDENARPVTPYINYLDSRTTEDVARVNAMGLEIWGKETGNAEASPMFPAMFARWFLRESPEFRERGVKFVHNAPFVLMNLAGLKGEDAFIDWGAMSGWGLGYDVRAKRWSGEQLSILGIDPKYMPRILKPWDVVGGLAEAFAERTGLAAGTPILAGAGDTMQSMLGSGIFEANQGVDVAGTCAMFCVSTKGIVPELSRPGLGLIFNSGTLPDTYFYWGFVRTGGLALRWFKDNICRREGDGSYYRTLSEGAARVPAGSNGVLFLPYLTGGYGEEDKNASGCFLNIGRRSFRHVARRPRRDRLRLHGARRHVPSRRRAAHPHDRDRGRQPRRALESDQGRHAQRPNDPLPQRRRRRAHELRLRCARPGRCRRRTPRARSAHPGRRPLYAGSDALGTVPGTL